MATGGGVYIHGDSEYVCGGKKNKTDKQTFELKSVREKNNQQLAD